jgi:hypothetical protein
MTYASDEDIEILRKYFSDDDFRATLEDPAPGIFDQSSWAKWNGNVTTGGMHFFRPSAALPSRSEWVFWAGGLASSKHEGGVL